MLVSHSKNFLFVHIYKTGGSTMTVLLHPYVDTAHAGDGKLEGAGWQSTWHLYAQHSRFAECLPTLDQLGIDPAERFLFTFVRNPYSWALSVWNNFYSLPTGNGASGVLSAWRTRLKIWLRGPQTQAEHFHALYPDGSFPSFLKFLGGIREGKIQPLYPYWGACDQYSFLENSRGIEFDFIGRFERFDKDVRVVLDRLDIPAPEELPHEVWYFKTKRFDYMNFYDETSLAIANDLFARDFDAFDYPKLTQVKKMVA
jgi:hypothetical protein